MKTVEVVQQIKDQFKDAIVNEIYAYNETTLEVRPETVKAILAFLKPGSSYGYEVLMDLTAVDYLEPIKQTKVVYWLHNPVNLQRLRLAVFVARDESREA